jgi:hypothetical protein
MNPELATDDCLCDFGRTLGYLHGYRRYATWTAFAVAIAATVLGQVADKPVHYREVDRINELTTLAALRDQSCAPQILQMESERGRQEPYALADDARRHPLRTALHQQTVDCEPVPVRERAQRFEYKRSLHNLTILRVSS